MISGRGRGGKIRPPRRAFTQDDTTLEESWVILENAIREIHARNASQLSYEQLFRHAYKIVLKKHGDMLFDNVTAVEIDVLDKNVRPKLLEVATPALMHAGGTMDRTATGTERRAAGEDFMRILTSLWAGHSLEVTLIASVCVYYNRTLVPGGQKPNIYQVGTALFRERLLQSKANPELTSTMQDLLEDTILNMIALERSGEIIDRPLIKAACQMLESLYETLKEEEETRLYLTSFEPKFLEASKAYYQNEGKLLVQESDATTFCSQAQKRLKEEAERCQQTLSIGTEQKIRLVVERELVSAHIRDVINLPGTGVKNMLDNEKVEDLQNVYDLMHRIDARLLPLKEAVNARVIEQGRDINKNAEVAAVEKKEGSLSKTNADNSRDKVPQEKPLNAQTAAAISWVDEVLKLRAKYDRVLVRAFRADNVMEKALEVSFQNFINENLRAPEFLSLFLDQYLKVGNKSKTEAEVDALLDDGVRLTQYLGDKDILESYCHKHMSKRLLQKKSLSRDTEKQIISKMKTKLGTQFTQKMEGLLKDAEISESLTTQYREYIRKTGTDSTIDLEANILTLTVWPFKANDDHRCIFPPEVNSSKESFERFYMNKHSGRKLTWMPNLGNAILRMAYKRDGKQIRYEVEMPTYCMVILLLFNQFPQLSYSEIQEHTQIPEAQLNNALQSISVAPKTRFLKKIPLTREVNLTDRFAINDDFTSKFLKIKVAMISNASTKVETSTEQAETKRKADDQRGHMIDAAVVRIMKSRKALSHNDLMTETITILSQRFTPEPTMIKKKIESLIEREYLERDENIKMPGYKYMA